MLPDRTIAALAFANLSSLCGSSFQRSPHRPETASVFVFMRGRESMRAAYLLDREIKVGDLPDPTPGPGQVLVRTHSCGICASDLHVKDHGQQLVDWSRAYNGPFSMDLSRPVVLGHEFVAEIVDYGPETRRILKKGTRATSVPVVPTAHGIECVGLSNSFPGGFGEFMVLSEAALHPLPDVLGSDLAAMAEPLSVGIYYVRAAQLGKGDVPLIIGCGAIGLAMILALKLSNAGPIIAADYSPARRNLALAMGADAVIDPAETSPFGAQGDITRQPPNVIFECVGVPGVMDQIMRNATAGARIMVAGWCLETDHMFTPCAHLKGLQVQYGGGPLPEDFAAAFRGLCEGRLDPTPWLGGRIGLAGVADAFDSFAGPGNPVRLIVDPRRA
jgi:threonine dehydrogenase-like Zn-dependent dehydrogenase